MQVCMQVSLGGMLLESESGDGKEKGGEGSSPTSLSAQSCDTESTKASVDPIWSSETSASPIWNIQVLMTFQSWDEEGESSYPKAD